MVGKIRWVYANGKTVDKRGDGIRVGAAVPSPFLEWKLSFSRDF